MCLIIKPDYFKHPNELQEVYFFPIEASLDQIPKALLSLCLSESVSDPKALYLSLFRDRLF